MNKTFNQADDNGRLIISEFILEEEIAILIDFKPEAGEYFKKKYHDIYKNWLLDVNKGKGLHNLVAKIVGVNKKKDTIAALKLEYRSGDATAYDDSGYQVFTCLNYPKGITMNIPMFLIKEIDTLGRSIF